MDECCLFAWAEEEAGCKLSRACEGGELWVGHGAVHQHLSFQFLRNVLPPFSSILLKVIAGVELKSPCIWVIMANPVSLHLIVN